MNKLAILIPTYNRKDILFRSIKALEWRMHGVEKFYFVGDDYGDLEQDELDGISESPVTLLTTTMGSLGANLNRLIRMAERMNFEYLLQMDDDHVLTQPIDMAPFVSAVGKGNEIGWIRLMGVGWHNYVARLRGQYWLVDWNSPEVYITSNRPHIKHISFHKHFGMYPEGKKLGETEESFCHQCKDKGKSTPSPFVAVPLGFNTETTWEHVGDSWQGKGL